MTNRLGGGNRKCFKCGKIIFGSVEHKCSIKGGNMKKDVLGGVLHEIGVWGLKNKIPVTKIDKLKSEIANILISTDEKHD